MGHYWAADTPIEIRRELALDWLDDLREFGPDIVAEACLAWRRQPGGKRPTPGDIRALCLRERAERGAPALALPASSVEAREQYARSLGFGSWAERQAAIDEQELRYRKAEAWRAEAKDIPGFQTPARALGVKVREYTPDEMAEGRRQLGLEPAQEDE